MVRADVLQRRNPFFNGTNLVKLVDKEEQPDPWIFFNAYFSSGPFTRRFFRSWIRNENNGRQFDLIIRIFNLFNSVSIFNEANCNELFKSTNLLFLPIALDHLHKESLLTQENVVFVLKATCTDPRRVASALVALDKAQILIEAHRALVAMHDSPDQLASVFSLLKKAQLLTPENQTRLTDPQNFYPFANLCSALVDELILNQENFDWLLDHPHPVDLASVLSVLRKAMILNKDNVSKVAKHADFLTLNSVLTALMQDSILDQDVFNQVISHANFSSLAAGLLFLATGRRLNKENFGQVANHKNLDSFASELPLLVQSMSSNQGFILTQEIFEYLVAHPFPQAFARALYVLNHSYILTPKNIDKLVAKESAGLFQGDSLWDAIPDYLSKERFEALLAAARAPDPNKAIDKVLNGICGSRPSQKKPALSPSAGLTQHGFLTRVHCGGDGAAPAADQQGLIPAADYPWWR